jgi:hypothetical protein
MLICGDVPIWILQEGVMAVGAAEVVGTAIALLGGHRVVRADPHTAGGRGYPAEFKRKVLDLVKAGRSLTDVARDLGISGQASTRGVGRTASIAAWWLG